MNAAFDSTRASAALEMYRHGQGFDEIASHFRTDANQVRGWIAVQYERDRQLKGRAEAAEAGWPNSSRLETLPISRRAIQTLGAAGIKTFGDLKAQWSDSVWRRALRKHVEFGWRTELAITQFLASHRASAEEE